jgi:hypothetical protein
MSNYDIKVWSSEEDIENGRMNIEIRSKSISKARLQWYYHDPDGRGRATQLWKNFMNYIHTYIKMNYIHTYIKTPDGVWDMAYALLAEYNAHIVEADYIEFDSEEDMTLFILRWI